MVRCLRISVVFFLTDVEIDVLLFTNWCASCGVRIYFKSSTALESKINTMTSSQKMKNMKREKLPEEFCAENIDNTAPPKKILNDIEQTNHKAFMFLNNTRRPRYKTRNSEQYLHHELPGHPLSAFPDDWEGDLSTEYFEPFPYKCIKPKMITVQNNIHKLDPVSELLKLKHEWFSKYVHMKNSCVHYKVNLIEKLTEHDDEVVSCPKHFVDMAEHLETDPDPYFTDTSNWYYAGNGNMQLVYFNYVEYIICSEFNFCYLFEFNKDNLTFAPYVAASFDCGEGNNIYESICSSQDIIALRTKLKVFVLKIVTSNDLIKIEQLKVAESEKPFTSISFDEHHKNILYVTDINNDLKIVNIDRLTARTIKMKNKIDSLVNNWSSVIGSDRTHFTHVAGNSINLYDKRTNKVIQTWDNLNKVTDDAACNRITVAKYSPGSTYLYFGTNHHLFLMDLRYQTNTDLKPLQRWTHGMQCYPTYMSICNFEFNKELICLSSQWCEDMCVVPNYIQSLNQSGFTGVTLPYRPPSILQTMNDARSQALCLDLSNSLENRLVAALTGILLVEQGDKYIILSQNGLGDISAHTLYPEHMEMFIEDDSVQALHDWSQDIVPEKKDFEVSFVRDISKVWKRLKKVPDGAINEQFSEETKFSEQEIHDMFQNGELDEGLLDVWVDEDETNVEDQSLGLSLNITKE